MNEIDALYRALCGYKKETGENRECGLVRKAVVSSNPEADTLVITRAVCTIEDDWINAIDEGLKHVKKAIDEGRQFILSRGEVVPIEQVKRVSKDSVEHLAKHSDFITKEQETEDLIPDKLYIVERLSDFAVYENRFLYMLLVYLRSFISFRYDKLLELSNTYHGGVTLNKTVAVNKRKLVFELKLDEEKRDDQYLKEHNPLRPVLDRIDLLLKTVIFLLSTPLMQEVAKVPMLKPPITKTNVLKMNRNFKGAVALYDFVRAYDKQGFTVENHEQRTNPFPQEMANEFAEVVALTSFLTYKHGLSLKKHLEKAYEDEDDRRRVRLIAEQKEQLARLRLRIAEEGGDPTEYILLLEKHIKTQDVFGAKLDAAAREIEKLHGEAEDFKQNILSLNSVIEEKQAEIDTIDAKYFDKMADLKQQYKKEAEETAQGHAELIKQLNLRHAEETEEINVRQTAERERRDTVISRLEELLAEKEKDYRTKADEYERLWDQKALSDSRLLAFRREYNLIPQGEEYTSEESFKELEHQLEVFIGLFKEEWGKTKKRIRREILRQKREREKASLAANRESYLTGKRPEDE